MKSAEKDESTVSVTSVEPQGLTRHLNSYKNIVLFFNVNHLKFLEIVLRVYGKQRHIQDYLVSLWKTDNL